MMRCVFIVLVLVAAPRLASAQTSIARVAWLQGCWRMNLDGQTVDEQWMAPAGGAMLGISRTVQGERLVEFEFVLLRERDGALVYIAHPSGQLGGEFPLKSVDVDSVTFENAAHDFPQRIGYRRRGDRRDAWIEGTLDGRSQRAEFPYARVACPAK
jgi:hypothetical protein